MHIAGEAPAIPEGLDGLLPAWAQGLSLLSLLILIVVAWLRGWVVTRAACDREVEAERRIADIWKANHDQASQLNEQLTGAFQPVLDSNAAILKVVEAMQNRQIDQERREEARAWLRDRGDPQG
jgi:Na+-transporting methylmalonyl-CoA/oxaloacetate decarboxylase gamma subunit